MAPTSPSWLSFASPIIGASGALLVYQRWIVDHRIKNKDDLIDSLRKDLETELRSKQNLEGKLRLAVEDTEKAYQTLEEFLGKVREADLAASDVLPLRRIIKNFQTLGSLQNELDDYKVAASRLRAVQSFLVKKASHRTIRNLKSSISEFQSIMPWQHKRYKRNFEADITSYLDWVYDCLYVSGHPHNNPLQRFVASPSIPSSVPYIVALRYIRDNGDWSTLSLDQAAFLVRMFDELLMKLPDEFSEE